VPLPYSVSKFKKIPNSIEEKFDYFFRFSWLLITIIEVKPESKGLKQGTNP
jgi:hypothetical protein